MLPERPHSLRLAAPALGLTPLRCAVQAAAHLFEAHSVSLCLTCLHKELLVPVFNVRVGAKQGTSGIEQNKVYRPLVQRNCSPVIVLKRTRRDSIPSGDLASKTIVAAVGLLVPGSNRIVSGVVVACFAMKLRKPASIANRTSESES